MPTGPLTRAVKGLRELVEAGGGDLTDRQLLDRFARQEDEAAFAQLVRRHGPLVLGVCRRVLRNWHDAEDAFQAAFLVLARRAAAVRWRDSAAGWLFRVAYRLALKMRAKADRTRTLPLPDLPGPDSGGSRPDGELRALLDEELSRLPEKYRVALLLCHCEGKTRAEAARQLGWKEGAVKIRLERGRALLRARLTRRGLAVPGLLLGSLLGQGAATAALPPTLAPATAAFARSFPLGGSPAAAARAAEVLRTMMLTRLRIAALLTLAVTVASLGLALGARLAFGVTPDEAAPPRPEAARQQQAERKVRAVAAPIPAKDPPRPLRVLLFAGEPSREFQFLHHLFARQAEDKQAEFSVYLQSGAGAVPAGRVLDQFPTHLAPREKKDPNNKPGNLAAYDVMIALDPDWTQLTEGQAQLLERWVGKEGRGLIVVAGPVNTPRLARPGGAARKLKPILDLLPVRLEDPLQAGGRRDPSEPWTLSFPGAAKFLKLDAEGKGPLAGWSEFFFGVERDDWQKTKDRPVRGFYAPHPVKSVQASAKVIAMSRDPRARAAPGGARPQDLPYLVVMPYGKGRTVYLGSSETWRLRSFRTEFHERFWSQLARYAALGRAGLGP
jgi:RNA polymerase sigma factor (sigma-70 family)